MGLTIEYYPLETGEYQVLITLTDNGSDNLQGLNSNEVEITLYTIKFIVLEALPPEIIIFEDTH